MHQPLQIMRNLNKDGYGNQATISRYFETCELSAGL